MNPGYEFSVVFPCLNSSEYTEKFLNSIVDCGYSLSNYVAVNNGSTDTTSKLLASYKDLNVVNNKKNYGFGIALNQGVMFKQTEWTILSNNDLVVSNDWVENLINSAIKNNLRVISPALIEGEYDYDLNNFIVCTGYKYEIINSYFSNFHSSKNFEYDSSSNKISALEKVPNFKLKTIFTGLEYITGG